MFSFLSNKKMLTPVVATTIVTGLMLTGCNDEGVAQGQQGGQPMQVRVMELKPESVSLSKELPGRTSAFRVAEVRARVSGIILKRNFVEGAEVSEGDLLFEIDPAPYQATKDSAKATLERAEANYISAKAQADRCRKLIESSAISQQAYDDAIALELASKADVAAAKAALQTAEINLGYTRVTSPISGRIGRAEVTEGAYVQQGTATLLATVQQLNPLYVDLTQSADEVLELQRQMEAGEISKNDNGGSRIQIFLSNGTPFPEEGILQFSDITVNETTGMVLLRGIIPNPDYKLLPGMFVKTKLDEGVAANALMVPQAIVSRNSKGDATVLAVSADNTVQTKVFNASRAVGDEWLVEDGLQSGDRLILENRQRLRPGMPIVPVMDNGSETK